MHKNGKILNKKNQLIKKWAQEGHLKYFFYFSSTEQIHYRILTVYYNTDTIIKKQNLY